MTIPYGYQLRGVRQLHRMKGRALVAWDPGCGKTFLSLLYLQRHLDIRPAVVVCPATLKWNWEIEAAKHINMRAEVLEGTKIPRGNLPSSRQLVILNYDILRYWLPWLKKLDPKLIIFDECHYLGNRASKRSKASKQLCENIPHVIGLSGTPLINRPSELWFPLSIIKPTVFPTWFDYGLRYCAGKRTHWGWDWSGSSNLDELHEILDKGVMLRLRKEDVLSLPPKRRAVIPLDMSDKREYYSAVKDFVGWLSKKHPAKKKALKAQSLVKIGYLKRLAAELKLKSVFSWVDDFLAESSGKIILFAVHKRIIEALRERYKDISVVVDGSVTGKDRQLAVNAFQNKKEVRIFIGNIRASGIGLTLTAASTVAFVELGWSPGEHVQAEDRAYRIGTVNPVMVYYLVAKETIESTLCEILQKKQTVLNQTLDGKGKGDDLDLIDQLEEALRQSFLGCKNENSRRKSKAGCG